MTQIRLSEKIGKGYSAFWNFHGRYLVVKGSRASKKSTTAALKLIYNLMKFPLSNALVVRQVFNTQRDSTFKQLQWAASYLDVAHLWKFTVSPLEATYTPTGQKIYFRGLDNPDSITSITVPFGFINFVWFEEAYQIRKEEDFNKIDLSIRGELPEGYYKQIILTFNPWSEKSWLKARFFDTPNTEDKLALTTNYLCNEWLGADDLKVFEEMKKSPRRYSIEGLGEWGISEGLIFDNWRVEEFDIQSLEYPLYLGLDFGYKDPTAIAALRIDEENKRIYWCQEFYKTNQLLEQVADWLKDNGYSKTIIQCDSAEPRSIEELKRLGIKRAKPVKKGQGSIMEGIRKLQEYEIILHPSCTNAEVEFSNYQFAKDKFDNWTDKPEDGHYNHLMDAARYAVRELGKNKLRTLDKNVL